MRRLLAAAALLVAAGCTSGGGGGDGFDGLWRSLGFGLLLEIDGGIEVFEHTSVSCAAVAAGPARDISGLEAAEGGRLELREPARLIVFDRVDVLPGRCGDPFWTEDPVRTLEVLAATMEEHYAFFDLRGSGWSERLASAIEEVDPSTEPAALLAVFRTLLDPLDDAQVRIAVDDPDLEPGGVWSAGPAPPEVETLAEDIRSGRVPLLEGAAEVKADGGVVSGTVAGGAAYLAINRLAGFDEDADREEAELARLLDGALADAGQRPLLLDLRVNRGGSEELALLVASRFLPEETRIASREVRVDGTDRYADAGDLIVRPLPTGTFPGRLVVLTGPGTAGAAETLVLALRHAPDVLVVGEATAGSLSPLLVRSLPNGWTLGLSHQRVFDAAGELWEARGIPPDVLSSGDPEEVTVAAVGLALGDTEP